MLPHQPQASRTLAIASPTWNIILGTVFSPAHLGSQPTPASHAETTFFDPTDSYRIGISLEEVDGNGDPVAVPNNDWSIDLMRSIDAGATWQVYRTFNMAQETEFDCPSAGGYRWQARMTVAGANNVRLRARS